MQANWCLFPFFLDAAKPTAHKALLDWLELAKDDLGDKYETCVRLVQKYNMEFGKSPFDTKEDAVKFFREKDIPDSTSLGAVAFNENQKYMGM